jgi:Fe2+ or Zn2+ uptake regulation protein
MDRQTTFQTSIQSSGRRLTHQRELVLGVLAESREHLDAETIHERVRGRSPRVSLATIYRTLTLLKGLGLVNEYKLGEEHGHFEAAPAAPHHHFTCLICHRVIEFSAPQIAEQTQDMLESQGIFLTDLRLQASGYCSDCQGQSLQKEHFAPLA